MVLGTTGDNGECVSVNGACGCMRGGARVCHGAGKADGSDDPRAAPTDDSSPWRSGDAHEGRV